MREDHGEEAWGLDRVLQELVEKRFMTDAKKTYRSGENLNRVKDNFKGHKGPEEGLVHEARQKV